MPSRPGPPKKPTALRLLEGNRGKLPINKAEPKPPPKVPAKPDYLSDEAISVWDRLAPELYRYGVITDWDAELFAAYCETVAQHRRAVLAVKPALLIKGQHDSSLVTNPAWRIYRDSVHLLRSLAQEFGLTPASRVQIEAQERLGADLSSLFTPIRHHS